MQIEIEPGMRVRCVRPDEHEIRLIRGETYTVKHRHCDLVSLADVQGGWLVDRFKPVVRVKATCVPSLSVLAMRARMTPEQQQAMQMAQRESWVRGEMALSKAERDQTRRSAPRS